MQEQNTAQKKGFITLKEAAEISGYSPDYVGQLIRAGKIKGEQVYSTVAWVTTPAEIDFYLQNKGKVLPRTRSLVDFSESKSARYGLYAVIIFLAFCLLGLQYVLYVSIDQHISEQYQEKALEGMTVVKEPAVLVYE